MDEADIAQRNQEHFERLALGQQRAGMPMGDSLEECEACGAVIPAARRKAAKGCTRCIGCQERFERRRR